MSVIDIVVWIPCTTAMPPEEKKEYLITVLDFRGTEERRRVLIAEYSLLKIVNNKAWWAFTRNIANSSEVYTNVIAWAHMPDPYDEPKINGGKTYDN